MSGQERSGLGNWVSQVVLVLGAAFLGWIGASIASQPNSDRLVLTDSHGRQLVLGTHSGEFGLFLMDKDDVSRAALTSDDESVRLSLMNAAGKERINLLVRESASLVRVADDKHEGQIVLVASDEDTAVVVRHDPLYALFSLQNGFGPLLSLSGREHSRLAIGSVPLLEGGSPLPDDPPTLDIRVFDSNGKRVWKALPE